MILEAGIKTKLEEAVLFMNPGGGWDWRKGNKRILYFYI